LWYILKKEKGKGSLVDKRPKKVFIKYLMPATGRVVSVVPSWVGRFRY